MEEMYADYLRESREWFREVSPDMEIGFVRHLDQGPYFGWDPERLGHYIGCFVTDGVSERRTSLIQGAILLCGGGYGQSFDMYSRNPWAAAFSGARGIWYYTDVEHLDIRGGYRPRSMLLWKGLHDLTEGVGMLLLNSQRQHDEIALLYSFDSSLAGHILGQRFSGNLADINSLVRYLRESTGYWEKIVKDAGLVPRWITAKDVVAGRISDYRAIVLPHTLVMSDATAEGLRRYVKDGGILVADVAAGLYDEHGQPREQAALSDVFGIKLPYVRNAFSHTASKYQVGFTKRILSDFKPTGWFDTHFFRHNLTVDKGQALGEWVFGGPPAFITNRFGKGTAVFLNMLPMNVHEPYNAKSLRNLVEEIARLGRIKPEVSMWPAKTVGRKEGYVSRFRNGDLEYLCLLKGSEPDMVISFTRKSHVYDVRERKYLGLASQVTKTILSDKPAAVLALSPYRVTSVKVRVPQQTVLGEDVPVEVAVKTDGVQPGDHVIRLEMLEPNGERSLCLVKNIMAKRGRGSWIFPLAHNDVAGKWTLVVRDVMSGMETRQTIDVTGKGGK